MVQYRYRTVKSGRRQRLHKGFVRLRGSQKVTLIFTLMSLVLDGISWYSLVQEETGQPLLMVLVGTRWDCLRPLPVQFESLLLRQKKP